MIYLRIKENNMFRLHIFLVFVFAVGIMFTACDSNDSNSVDITDIHSLEGDTDVRVEGRGLLLNGQPFTVKGVNYSPIPIGTTFDDGDKIGDVFFDYFNPIHKVDFQLMKEMGVNTLRIYGMFPWHPQNGPSEPRDHTNFLDMAFEAGICVFITYPIGDEAFSYKVVQEEPTDGSFFVILPTAPGGGNQIWVPDEDTKKPGFLWLGEQTAAERRESDREAYLALAEKYKDHPAVFGWVLTNEKNSPQSRVNPSFWSYLNDLAGELKTIAPEKETMIALIDDGMVTLQEVAQNDFQVSNIDIWGINSYRGNVVPEQNNFDNLFTSYIAVSDKPLIITEFGPPSSTRTEIVSSLGVPVPPGDASFNTIVNNNYCPGGTFEELTPTQQEFVADYIEGHWQDIENNLDVAAGGIVFAWVDEWWKSGDKNVQNQSAGINTNFPGGCWDEEVFGINAIVLKRATPATFPAVFIPDERVPRAQFDRLKQLWTGN